MLARASISLLVFSSTIMCPWAALAGPFAPAAGQPGSTAIAWNDPAFVGWATGWQNYVVGANVDAQWQTPANALGPASTDVFNVVVLGNGGQITLTFDKPIKNGPGWDFAVFENGFSDTFLELAYVEVSSNGTDFFRFDSVSLTPAPVGGFGSLDTTNIDGLAGKYRVGFGTPFDLNDLAGVSSLLDVNQVGYVRIVDIVGDGTYLDSFGNPIYDLHPTVGSGGFDLQAVGVVHAVPEPASLLLVLSCLATLLAAKRRRPILRPGLSPASSNDAW